MICKSCKREIPDDSRYCHYCGKTISRKSKNSMFNFETNDLIYYAGLMAGVIIGFKVLDRFGFTGIIQLIGALVIGVGCGYLAEKIIMPSKK